MGVAVLKEKDDQLLNLRQHSTAVPVADFVRSSISLSTMAIVIATDSAVFLIGSCWMLLFLPVLIPFRE